MRFDGLRDVSEATYQEIPYTPAHIEMDAINGGIKKNWSNIFIIFYANSMKH